MTIKLSTTIGGGSGRPRLPLDPQRAEVSALPPKKRKPSATISVLKRREARIAFAFVLPVLILFILFRFGPAFAGVGLSLFDYKITGELTWQGLANFERMFADPLFWRALTTTLVFALFAAPLGIVISTILALGVRRAFVGSRFFRSVFFLPVITSPVLLGSIFIWIFSADGPWSNLMAPIGLDGSWLAQTALVIPALVIVGIWTRFGFGMLILLAALQDVPRELEEAALVDGANAWQRFWTIILPQLRPTLFFLAVIETTFAFQVFEIIYVTTQGGPAHASYSLVYMLYDQGFKYANYGYAAAVGVALFVITLALGLIQRAVIGRRR